MKRLAGTRPNCPQLPKGLGPGLKRCFQKESVWSPRSTDGEVSDPLLLEISICSQRLTVVGLGVVPQVRMGYILHLHACP